MAEVESAPINMFEYNPLENDTDSIRLLDILPGEAHEPIRCNLRHVKLYTKAKFTCLSYTWGQESAIATIFINGQTFAIRPNLQDFLQQARRIILQRQSLWIDAICIDQSNDEERSAQVRLASQIYQQADQVIIYPGASAIPRGLKSANVLYWTQGFLEACVTTGLSFRIQTHYKAELRRLYEWIARDCSSFFELPYWSRLWIVQEIALARKARVLIADKLIPFSYFKHAPQRNTGLSYKMDLFGAQQFTSQRLHAAEKGSKSGRKLYNIIQSLFDMAEVLDRFSGHLCKEPNDRVYALLGLLTVPTAFPVSYERRPATIVLDVLEHFPIHYSNPEYPNGQGFARKLMRISHGLRVHPFVLCKSCFLETRSDAESEYLDTLEHSVVDPDSRMLFYVTEEVSLGYCDKSRGSAMILSLNETVDLYKDYHWERPTRSSSITTCDKCEQAILDSDIQSDISMTRINDSILCVTITGKIDTTKPSRIVRWTAPLLHVAVLDFIWFCIRPRQNNSVPSNH